VIGRPGVIHLTPGNVSDVKTAPAVLAQAPGPVRRLIADKGYDADWLRQDLRQQGISVVIPGTRARKRKIRLDKLPPHRHPLRQARSQLRLGSCPRRRHRVLVLIES
jgi:transposase